MLQYPGLEKAFELQLKENDDLLEEAGLEFKNQHIWLTTVDFSVSHGWMIYLSVRTLNLRALLKDVLPVLKEEGVAFSVVKDENEAYRLNAGLYGPHLIGKVVRIVARSEEEARQIISKLVPVTGKYTGCMINDSTRISNIIYVQRVFSNSSTVERKEHFPFPVERRYRKPASRRFIGLFYLPVQEIYYNLKVTIYKGFNFKRPFRWCLIKQGNSHTSDDHFGRDIRDKFCWQKRVIRDLEQHISTPRFIDLVEYEEFSFLILEYVEGVNAGQWVEQLRQGKAWKDLASGTRKAILDIYLSILSLVRDMHVAGYVHRDINERNFIIDSKDKIYIIDFEMSCCLKDGLPDPPFTLGTIGYISPEQMNYMKPHPGDDVYSLGALLAYFLTGALPQKVFLPDRQETMEKLAKYGIEPYLADIIMEMTNNNPLERASLNMAMTHIRNQAVFNS